MCAKYWRYELYPSVLSERISTPYRTGTHEDLRGLWDCPGLVETKGFLTNAATEHALAFTYKRSFICGT